MEDTAVVDAGEPTLSTAEKRPIQTDQHDELFDPHLSKKPRNALDFGPNLRRVAEIVLVMSTMTELRAGKKPTDVEVELLAEARAKLVQICQGLAPKDIVGREAITSLIEELGLHGKARDHKLGFRPPRLTITEKFAQSKKKMEDSKKYIPPPGYGSHPTQTNFTSSVESRGALPTVRMFPSDKSSYVPTSVGGTAAALPSGHVSVSGSTSIQVQAQLPSNEVRTHIISSGFPTSHQGRDSSSLLHGIERPLNGTYASQMQVHSSVNHPLANAPTWSAQTQSTLSAKGVPDYKLPNHSGGNAQGSTDSRMLRPSSQGPYSQAEKDQNFRPPISQTVTGNIVGLPPHLQSMNFVQGPSLSNNHNEIVKIIQKLLQPQLPDHPTWNPPSRDYMSKAVTCQTCQVTINEIDSVLICDACEKGFHLKCVQSPNQRAIPRGEWHCPRCLTISNGKPLPPKYGRVMRSNPPPKLSVNTSGTQLSEKRLGAIEQNPSVGQLKLVSNGGSALRSPQPVDHGSNANESSGIKIPDVEEIHGNHFLPIRKDIDDSTSLNTPAKSLELVCDPSSARLSSERSTQHIKISQDDIGEDGSSSKAEPPEESQTVADNSSNPNPPDISPIVDQKMVSNSPEKPYSSASAHDTSSVKKDDHEVLEESNVENLEASIINREQSIYQKMVSNSPVKPYSSASAHDTSSVKKDDHELLEECNVENFEAGIINKEQSIYQKMVSNSAEKPYSPASVHDTSNVKKDDHEVLEESNVANFESSIINREQSIYQKMVSNSPEKPYSPASVHDTSSVKKDDHEVLQESNVENFETSITNREQSGTSSDDLHDVEWIGMPHQVADGREYYKSCRIDGVTYKVEEFALFHSSNGKLMPYRLQSMCREFGSGSNLAVLKKCYLYEDLPKEVDHLRPCSPEQNEVYTSDGYIWLNVGLIRGPCEILPVAKYKEEYERRRQSDLGADNGVKPIFLCKWFYSEARKEFVPFTGAVCENLTAIQI